MGNWTNSGFQAHSLSYYVDELRNIFTEAYGDEFVLDQTTPQGVLITRIAQLLYNTDMDGIEAYSRLNLLSATGVYLDLMGALRGITRIQGTPQMATVRVTCSTPFMPFTIPAGTEFNALNSIDVFVSGASIMVNSATTTISLNYKKNGNSGIVVGDKLQVVGFNQITDMEVTNLVDGQGVETDADYRLRLQLEYPAANNTITFVENKLLELPLVKSVGHEYNDTSSTQGGIPPYCTEWMAVPKEGADLNTFKNSVAEAILNNKVPGSPTHGNTTVTATDICGDPKQVKFTIPTKVEMMVDVEVVTPETTGIINLGNIPEIKQEIMDYINNLQIGKDVSFSRCAAPLFADKGFDVSVFKMKSTTDTDWVVSSNYTIGRREYAAITFTHINITIG